MEEVNWIVERAIDEAFKNGASLVFTSDRSYVNNNRFFFVKNLTTCLLKVAEFWLRHFNPIKIAITGSNGKEADARNCVLILTTNLGAEQAERGTIGFGDDWEDEYEDEELKRFFAPEFRNRLDGVITFGKLSKEVMLKIVGKFLLALKNQIDGKNIDLTIDDPALDYLVEKGYDRKMGARPLQRVIDREIKKPLSRAMLFGELKNGGKCKIILASNDSLKLQFKKEKIEKTTNKETVL